MFISISIFSALASGRRSGWFLWSWRPLQFWLCWHWPWLLLAFLGAVRPMVSQAADEKVTLYPFPLRAPTVAYSGAVLQAGLMKYQADYRCTQWSGELSASRLDAAHRFTEAWSAGPKIPAAALRKIWTWDGTRARAIPFTYEDLQASALLAWSGESQAQNQQDLIAYLRGDSSNEAAKKQALHAYRNRDGVLGDIVNSRALHLGAQSDTQGDMQYAFLPTQTPGQSTYGAFLKSKAQRAPMVFVGANDGMLHALDAHTGVEKWAYMPAAVLAQLPRLSQQDYVHRFYVDGPLVAADVFDGKNWRSLLLGTPGAGGVSIFAIDATDPNKLGATSDAGQSVLWEKTGADVGAALGHVLAPIETGLMMNGRWAVILGNGHNSPGAKTELIILDALTGALIKSIAAPSDAAKGGLTAVRVVRDAQQRVVAAYGGDLAGHLWRFDLQNSQSGNWRLGFAGNPLALAWNGVGSPSSARPITASPEYIEHPLGGTLVLFGSGQLLQEQDARSTEVEYLWGIWDKTPLGQASQAGDHIDATRHSAVIQTQTFQVSALSGSEGNRRYSSSNKPVNWATDRGWQLALNLSSGQRLLDKPDVVRGFALFQTIVPVPPSATDPCFVKNHGRGLVVLVNALTGGMSARPVLGSDAEPGAALSAWETDSTAQQAFLLDSAYRIQLGQQSFKLEPSLPVQRSWRILR